MDMDKEMLVDRVIYQIQMDLENMDTTAVAEMLANLDDEFLIAYLPEEKQNA